MTDTFESKAPELQDCFKRRQHIVISGAAGTGKTTAAKQLPGILGVHFTKVLWAAPTNKAVYILHDKIREHFRRSPYGGTIHSVLGLRLGDVSQDRSLVQNRETDLSEYQMIVVDECSMLNEYLLKKISEKQQAYPKLFWVFLGDNYQLPPVKESCSKIFLWPDYQTFNLTVIHRQKTEELLREVWHYRQLMDNPFGNMLYKGLKKIYISHPSFQKDWIPHFQSGDAKIIAWRNATVNNYNKIIRDMIFNCNPYPWLEGDKIVLASPLMPQEESDLQPVPTDTEASIEAVKETTIDCFGEIYSCYLIQASTQYQGLITIPVLRGDIAIKEHKKTLTALFKKAQATQEKKDWKAYWAFHDFFPDVRYAYALTSHRSQGSTYKHVLVDWRDIGFNKDQSRYNCLYVAVSRAAESIHHIF